MRRFALKGVFNTKRVVKVAPPGKVLGSKKNFFFLRSDLGDLRSSEKNVEKHVEAEFYCGLDFRIFIAVSPLHQLEIGSRL